MSVGRSAAAGLLRVVRTLTLSFFLIKKKGEAGLASTPMPHTASPGLACAGPVLACAGESVRCVAGRERKYIVRNSPVDISATMFRGTIHTLKTAVNFTIGTGLTFGLCHELDQILVDEGMEPYFVPKIKSAIASAGLDDALPWWRS